MGALLQSLKKTRRYGEKLPLENTYPSENHDIPGTNCMKLGAIKFGISVNR